MMIRILKKRIEYVLLLIYGILVIIGPISDNIIDPVNKLLS